MQQALRTAGIARCSPGAWHSICVKAILPVTNKKSLEAELPGIFLRIFSVTVAFAKRIPGMRGDQTVLTYKRPIGAQRNQPQGNPEQSEGGTWGKAAGKSARPVRARRSDIFTLRPSEESSIGAHPAIFYFWV